MVYWFDKGWYKSSLEQPCLQLQHLHYSYWLFVLEKMFYFCREWFWFCFNHCRTTMQWTTCKLSWWLQQDVFSCDQAALWMVQSVCLPVCLSVCLWHLFDYVPIIVSSWNFRELLPMTEVTSMQKVKVWGQRSRFPDRNFSLNSHMMMKWCTQLDVAKRYPIVFQGHASNFKVTRLNKSTLTQIRRFHTVTPVWVFTNGYEIVHRAWSSIEQMPYCFQGHLSNFKVTLLKKIVDFDLNWLFPDCNSNLNSLMAMKWCTKLKSDIEEVPYCFLRSSVKF